MPMPRKPDATRRRRNVESKSIHIPAGSSWAKHRPVPKLPKRENDRAWAKPIRDWWASIWESEMSCFWLPSDIEPLTRLATLKQALHDAGDRGLYVEMLDGLEIDGTRRVVIQVSVPTSVLSAIKDLEDRYALNQLARRRAGIEIDPPASGDPGGVAPGAGGPTPRSDRRARLSIVS